MPDATDGSADSRTAQTSASDAATDAISAVAATSRAADIDAASPAAINVAGRRIHFVGIGGCGMSGLARIVKQAGAHCSGSDIGESPTVASLRDNDINVKVEQSADTVPSKLDLMVISAAIKPDHPEVVEATRRGVEVIKYARMLGRMMIGRTGVAIAGTHGKSTTTSLLSHILIQTGLDPSFIVGANCKQIGGGSRVGKSDILVGEACEYDRSFHNFHPTHSVILNIEEDHLDLYSGIEEILESFATFAARTPEHGSLLIQHELGDRLRITAGLDCAVETIGFAPQADWRVTVDRQSTHALARPLVTLFHRGDEVASWPAPMPGDHMAYNAAVAAVTAHRLGADWEGIASAVASFEGLDRRMQRLGQRAIAGGDVTVVDDYGHHPTEIDATLRALRNHYSPRRLICVFQPHQHSRTRFLMEQFAASFEMADIVILPHIYFVRDTVQERQAVRSSDLVDRLRHRNVRAMHLYPFDAIVEQLEVVTQPGDLVVTMGAGDVWQVSRDFLNRR